MVYPIKVKSVDDIKRLSKLASECLFDIWVHSVDGKIMLDAKSFMSLILLTDIDSDLVLVVPDNTDKKNLEKRFKQYELKVSC